MSLTCLITGGAGFIGSHLSAALHAEGCRVLVLDDLSTGDRRNLADLEGRDGYEFHLGSVDDPARVDPLVARADRIYHLAAVVGVARVVESPIRTIETNLRGTDVVLAAADRWKRRVLLASTSEVYGKSTALPFREDADLVFGPTDRGRWSYACSKALDEYLALAYHAERGLEVVIARLFNTVGPRQSAEFGMVLPRFVKQALAGQPITVYGDGSHTRCFCAVTDAVAALRKLMEAPQALGRVFNVGSEEEVSVRELAERVKARLGSASPIVFRSYQEVYGDRFEESVDRKPDLARIHAAIGYRPQVGLDAIIDAVAADFRVRG